MPFTDMTIGVFIDHTYPAAEIKVAAFLAKFPAFGKI